MQQSSPRQSLSSSAAPVPCPGGNNTARVSDFSSQDPARALALLVSRLVAAAQPERIILFGSRARGDHRPDSDFDILVVMRQPIPEPWQVARVLRRAAGVIGFGKDIIVADQQHVHDEAGLHGSLIGMALREGKEIWPHAA